MRMFLYKMINKIDYSTCNDYDKKNSKGNASPVIPSFFNTLQEISRKKEIESNIRIIKEKGDKDNLKLFQKNTHF